MPTLKDNSFSIHERNIQSLAIEIYKFLNGLSPNILNNDSHKNIANSYDLRNHKELYTRNPKTVRYGTETCSYIALKIWSKVTETIKMILSLESFKSKIRKYKPECDCRLCTKKFHHVGLINVIQFLFILVSLMFQCYIYYRYWNVNSCK